MTVDLSFLRAYFWDVDAARITWQEHRDFVVRRVLQRGDYHALRWLRAQMGDVGLREWIVEHNARGLSPRRIRYWALVLDIEPARADDWIKTISALPWSQRR